LRLDQDEIDKEDDKVMLDIFVREAFTARTLGQTHAFAECFVIGFAVCCVERADGIPTFDTNRHDTQLQWLDPDEVGSVM